MRVKTIISSIDDSSPASPQASRTRAAILEAAQKLFATRTYVEANVRDIAAAADVSPALISRYFGSKLALFEAVLEASLEVTVFTQTPRAGFGERVAEVFCQSSATGAHLVPMLVFAAGDATTRNTAYRLMRQLVVEPLEAWFGEPEGAERAAQLLTVVMGFFTYRLMLPLEPEAIKPSPAMQSWLAGTLQTIVDR